MQLCALAARELCDAGGTLNGLIAGMPRRTALGVGAPLRKGSFYLTLDVSGRESSPFAEETRKYASVLGVSDLCSDFSARYQPVARVRGGR